MVAKREPTRLKAIYAKSSDELCAALHKMLDDDAQARLIAELTQRLEGITLGGVGAVSVYADRHHLLEGPRCGMCGDHSFAANADGKDACTNCGAVADFDEEAA
jgi:hypothetical protein